MENCPVYPIWFNRVSARFILLSGTLHIRSSFWFFPFTVLKWVRMRTKIDTSVVTPSFGQKSTSATKQGIELKLKSSWSVALLVRSSFHQLPENQWRKVEQAREFVWFWLTVERGRVYLRYMSGSTFSYLIRSLWYNTYLRRLCYKRKAIEIYIRKAISDINYILSPNIY